MISYMLLNSPLTHLQLQVPEFCLEAVGDQVNSLITSVPPPTSQASLRPSPDEVSACMWADTQLARAVVSAADGEDLEVGLDHLPSSIR